MKVGYARVSTQDQNLSAQIEALKTAGCKKIFKEKVSATKDRPQLNEMLNYVKEGDIVVIWKIDRLGRSVIDLINIIERFRRDKIEFISLTNNIDTTTASGRLVFSIFASFAEFERELISERTKFSLANLKAKGVKLGHPSGVSEKGKNTAFKALELTGKIPVYEICSRLSLTKPRYYRYIKWAKENV